MAGAACYNFKPNFWRPTTCSNCLLPKRQHVLVAAREQASNARAGAEPSKPKREPKRLVGVVSPYAVVEVKAESVSAANTERSTRKTKVCIAHKSPPAPKRKAPPPPLLRQQQQAQPGGKEAKAASSNTQSLRPVRKTGPEKPPRTQSTYLEDVSDQRDKEYSVLSDCSHEPRGWVGEHLACIMTDTVQRVYAKFLEQVMRPDPLWEVSWRHLSLLSPNTAAYKGVHMSLQMLHGILEQTKENDIIVSQYLSPHPNLCLVRAILPPPSLPALSCSSHYLLRDGCGLGTLAQLLPERRSLCSPQQLEQLLLMCMVQVLSAVQFIYGKGVCHRDIGLDCLYVTQYGQHWIVKLAKFDYAVYCPGPVSATSFVYNYQDLQWLGGADSHLPPEIMSTSENAQTLDYSGTDCFAAGCLFYEILGQDNPFELNSRLVHSHYRTTDLPNLPGCSPNTHKLACLLLSKEPQNRPSSNAAVLLCQSLLWLPEQMLNSPVSETSLQEKLEYDRGSLVASLATMDLRPVPLTHVLRAHFLHSCDIAQLLCTLMLLHKQ